MNTMWMGCWISDFCCNYQEKRVVYLVLELEQREKDLLLKLYFYPIKNKNKNTITLPSNPTLAPS